MKRLAIVTSHPIQYNAPLFALLAERARIAIHVFYTWGDSVLHDKYDPGFGKVIQWDIPLLQGYAYSFVENTALDKGSHHFKGIINPELIKAVTDYQPTAILVYGWSFQSHLKLMRHFKGKVPLIFRGDSTLLDDSGWLQSIKRNLFLRWVYRHIDWALYAGKSNRAYFLKAGISEQQLIFGPHAIDNNRYACTNIDCQQAALAWRKQLNIPTNDLLFLFAGKFENKKDPALLLEAFSNASFSRPAHLMIVGNGEMENVLKQHYADKPGVHFIGFQNQAVMPSIYAAADVFVLPSKGPGETWGLAVNEAMAAGKAIIVSDRCGSAADLVDDAVNGYVLESGNEKQLTNYLETMNADRSKVLKMGKASQQKIAGYSFEVLANSLEQIVLKIKEPSKFLRS